MSQPSARVSVVIPCFNQGQFLAEALQSVFQQTYPAHEIILVDDGSTDETATVASSYSGVQYVRQQNAGPGAARNRGIQLCTGDFVVFLDADDRLLPNHFAACLEAFAQKPESVMVWGDFRWFGAPDTWHVHDCTPRPDYYGAMLTFKIMGPPATLMLRRSVFSEVGGFRTDLPTCEDLEMWLRIARSHPVHCHHELVAEYRRHPAQMHQRWDRLLLGGLQVLREERRMINGHRVYEQALRAGIEQHLRACGEPLLWHTVAAVKSARWQQAARNLWLLVRFYPQGLLRSLHHKLTRPYSELVKVRQPRT